jgi:hypothetical protein
MRIVAMGLRLRYTAMNVAGNGTALLFRRYFVNRDNAVQREIG